MATVDGVTTGPDSYGIIQGAPGQEHVNGTNKLAGGAGNDKLEGHGDFNQYYGGAGSDTFILAAKFGQQTSTATTDFTKLAAYITDFQGAGGYSATDNDFIALSGFGANSTLDLIHTGSTNAKGATLYYYSVTDGVTGQHYNFEINSLNGNPLGAGDFSFV